MQHWAAEEAKLGGQSLAVIEDLTGAGKTEAGLILAHRLMAGGAAEGLYWALPTMATADALYARLQESYGRLFADAGRASLILAHSARDLNAVFTKSIFTPEAETEPRYGDATAQDRDDGLTASAACARWLADDRRKTFLADIGIGTIDQALLGVLPAKHQALRLAALCRRVLVIDEAHSYDPYMTRLMEVLIGFQGALGGSVIVMSATLTLEVRRRLAKAFAMGAGWGAVQIKETAFPLATLITRGQLTERSLPSSRGTRRDLPVRRLDGEAAAIETLKTAAAEGLGAVWFAILSRTRSVRTGRSGLLCLGRKSICFMPASRSATGSTSRSGCSPALAKQARVICGGASGQRSARLKLRSAIRAFAWPCFPSAIPPAAAPSIST